jgi:DNA polymerase-3 subunit alpha
VLELDSDKWSQQRPFSTELATILKPYCGGQCPISIEYQGRQAKTVLQLGDDWRVYPTDELLIRLRRLLSSQSVLVKYRA